MSSAVRVTRNLEEESADFCVGESQVSEESMAKVAESMAEKGVSKEDGGAVLVDFESLIPGKEGKRLGKAVVRYVLLPKRQLSRRHEP